MAEDNEYKICCIGHKNLKKIYKYNDEITRMNVDDYLNRRLRFLRDKGKSKITIMTKLKNGASQLFIEEAMNNGVIPTIVIPKDDKNKNRKKFKSILENCDIIEQEKKDIDSYMIQQCQEVLCLWDGNIEDDEVLPSICLANAKGIKVIYF